MIVHLLEQQKKGESTLKLNDEVTAEELKMLHKKFVVIQIDKSRVNVAFVCKRRYAQVLINELGLNDITNITSLYTKAT